MFNHKCINIFFLGEAGGALCHVFYYLCDTAKALGQLSN